MSPPATKCYLNKSEESLIICAERVSLAFWPQLELSFSLVIRQIFYPLSISHEKITLFVLKITESFIQGFLYTHYDLTHVHWSHSLSPFHCVTSLRTSHLWNFLILWLEQQVISSCDFQWRFRWLLLLLNFFKHNFALDISFLFNNSIF